jgi:TRAP-type C4-dicarboxylate transport system permease small subunit
MRILALVFKRLLEGISLGLLVLLAVIVVLAVVYRTFGMSLIWYDELASVLLAWLTYFGAALAALKRAHLGFTGILTSSPLFTRKVMFWFSEVCVYGFVLVCAYAGWYVLRVFGNESLVSLPIPLSVTQSVVPIGFVLFAIAQLASTRSAYEDLVLQTTPKEDFHS